MIEPLNLPNTISETEAALERKLNQIIDVVNRLEANPFLKGIQEGYEQMKREQNG